MSNLDKLILDKIEFVFILETGYQGFCSIGEEKYSDEVVFIECLQNFDGNFSWNLFLRLRHGLGIVKKNNNILKII